MRAEDGRTGLPCESDSRRYDIDPAETGTDGPA
ncbi:hypothetical protein MBUL_03005 [Methylobacterium bullatum]|uniref:Uncharacterized protein n=1 Tax=Methylobacterium bullatum TaxID=570505 RepID=A0A679JFC7_9HYPH|nr:hypothetical protein MBUL_03005 [Methylobacterium bullatum]